MNWLFGPDLEAKNHEEPLDIAAFWMLLLQQQHQRNYVGRKIRRSLP